MDMGNTKRHFRIGFQVMVNWSNGSVATSRNWIRECNKLLFGLLRLFFCLPCAWCAASVPVFSAAALNMLLARALQDSHTVILQVLLPFSCPLYCSSSWKTRLCFYELFRVLISLVLMCLLLELVCCLRLGCREVMGMFLKTISFLDF